MKEKCAQFSVSNKHIFQNSWSGTGLGEHVVHTEDICVVTKNNAKTSEIPFLETGYVVLAKFEKQIHYIMDHKIMILYHKIRNQPYELITHTAKCKLYGASLYRYTITIQNMGAKFRWAE